MIIKICENSGVVEVGCEKLNIIASHGASVKEAFSDFIDDLREKYGEFADIEDAFLSNRGQEIKSEILNIGLKYL